jgi:hypothetical protein
MQRPYVLFQLEPVVHIQETPVDTLVIEHNKEKFPKVVVTDLEGQEISVVVKHTDLNHIKILSCEPITFKVYIY